VIARILEGEQGLERRIDIVQDKEAERLCLSAYLQMDGISVLGMKSF
jgi:hypothetical protein